MQRVGEGTGYREHLVQGERGHRDDGGVGGDSDDEGQPALRAWRPVRQAGDDEDDGGDGVGQTDGHPQHGRVAAPPVTGLDQHGHRAEHHLQVKYLKLGNFPNKR